MLTDFDKFFTLRFGKNSLTLNIPFPADHALAVSIWSFSPAVSVKKPLG